MGAYLKHINLDGLFHSVANKIVLNELSYLEDFSDLKDQLYTVYEDVISIVPQCVCGKTSGAWQLGKTCPYCGTEVVNKFETIKPILWVRAFNSELKFLSPHFWGQLRNLFKTKGSTDFDAIRYITDTSYKVNQPIRPVIQSIISMIGGRGYSNFINNLDKVFTLLKNNSAFRINGKLDKILELEALWRLDMKENNLLSEYLPLINSRLFVMEVTNKGKFASSMLSDIIDIALYSIKVSKETNRQKQENGMAYVISATNTLFATYMKDHVASKKGIVRRHIYGTRVNFTFRAVITALPLKYDYDTIHVPWVVGVSAFRPHVLNKLLKRGYRYRDASELLFASANMYKPEIDEIFKELIEEAPSKGIAVILHRNPSLLQGSAQRVYITKFKTDIDDKTISTSVMIAKAANADFDGV